MTERPIQRCRPSRQIGWRFLTDHRPSQSISILLNDLLIPLCVSRQPGLRVKCRGRRTAAATAGRGIGHHHRRREASAHLSCRAEWRVQGQGSAGAVTEVPQMCPKNIMEFQKCALKRPWRAQGWSLWFMVLVLSWHHFAYITDFHVSVHIVMQQQGP